MSDLVLWERRVVRDEGVQMRLQIGKQQIVSLSKHCSKQSRRLVKQLPATIFRRTRLQTMPLKV